MKMSYSIIGTALLALVSTSAFACGGDGGDPQHVVNNLNRTAVKEQTSESRGKGGDGSDPRGANGPSKGGDGSDPRNR